MKDRKRDELSISSTKKSKEEERLDQIQLISRLASRLPWIVVIISLLAFLIIFLQAAYLHK